MKTEQQSGVAAGGAHIHRNHSWGGPLPGAGSMAVCKKCGEKFTTYTDRAECVGLPAVGAVESMHDYDPHS